MKSELPQIVWFGREICGDLAQAERREWWLANGLGGYAAGTIAGTLTRRYHGLLVAPLNPPLGRVLVVAKADATLMDGERSFPLFTNRWAGGVVDPAGHVNIESFHLDGRMPVWIFAIGDIRLEQRVWMEHGANTSYVAWRVAGRVARPLKLKVNVLVNARDHHQVSRVGESNPEITCRGDEMRVDYPNRFTLRLRARGGSFCGKQEWHENFDLSLERERGLEDRDNHLCVGEATLVPNHEYWVGIVATVEIEAAPSLEDARSRFHARDLELLHRARAHNPALADAPEWIDQLVLAADNFIFARPLRGQPDGESVIAGYPWFGDWGRDSMIALPGLTLATGRVDSARRILQTFARFVHQGMLPNLFPGAGEQPDYNTADAALWYFEAWRAYFESTGDASSLQAVYPVLDGIIAAHVKGTRYGIVMDAGDGLLRAGEPGVQVTWMDAKVGEWVVTPRIGKPVEINALWYNALCAMAWFAKVLKRSDRKYKTLADNTRQGFAKYQNSLGGLYDVLDGPDGNDDRLRPNQIFAVSLAFSPLPITVQQNVVELCGKDLLTSLGLRSLAPRHRDYRPHYQGGIWERDGAYHQGTVWAWLLGHYALALNRVQAGNVEALQCLAPIRDHLLDAGLGTVSEIFDGAAPHAARGCPAQAWSVACILEAWLRLQPSRAAER